MNWLSRIVKAVNCPRAPWASVPSNFGYRSALLMPTCDANKLNYLIMAQRIGLMVCLSAAMHAKQKDALKKKLRCDGGSPSCVRKVLVLFGDSNTGQSFRSGGWGGRLGDHYICRADVLNRGYPGYNTRFGLLAVGLLLRTKDAKSAAEQAVSEHLATASVWTVMFGTNDSGLPEGGFSIVHVPLAEYEQSLAAIVQTIQGATETTAGRPARILLLTPPVVDDTKLADPQGVQSHTNANTGRYADAARRVAAKCNVALVDVHEAMTSSDQPAEFLSDGLHLSEKGDELIYDLVKNAIAKHWPELSTSALTLDLPSVAKLWGDQDYKAAFREY